MAIYKQEKSGYWYIDFVDANGKRVRQSAGTESKQQAQELHDKLKHEAWRVKNVGDKPRYTWQQAVIRWMSEKSHKRTIKNDRDIFVYLNDFFGDRCLDEIDRRLIDEVRQKKLSTGVANGTVNRILALIRAVLNAAKDEWEWLDNAPTVKSLPESANRIRWLTYAESEKLLKELPWHLAAMMRFTLATGLRETNVTFLEWSQVDLQKRCAWIHADQAKGKKSIAVPLNDNALAVLRSQIGKHETRVFTFKGNPVLRANNHAWRNALKRAGIENFRWHDLRHTWASWHIQNGTPINVLKELGGWADLTMVLRYAHLSSDHLASYANNSNQSNDKILSYPQKSPADENRRRA
jgi:integrase